jgi:hypothetical protein
LLSCVADPAGPFSNSEVIHTDIGSDFAVRAHLLYANTVLRQAQLLGDEDAAQAAVLFENSKHLYLLTLEAVHRRAELAYQDSSRPHCTEWYRCPAVFLIGHCSSIFFFCLFMESGH